MKDEVLAEFGITDFKLPQHPCDAVILPKKQFNKKSNSITITNESISEIDYCNILNRVLPANIRVLAWKEVTPHFSARFSAGSRTYRYFFVNRRYANSSNKCKGQADDSNLLKYQLDITKMNEEAALLIGKHDFRNLCKMDVSSVSNYEREIYSAEIKLFSKGYEPTNNHDSNTNNDMNDNDMNKMTCNSYEDVYMLEITGLAFLWHMVRCIMSVLFLVGYRLEDPDIISKLFDIKQIPARPNYAFANELPLVLHKCSFDHLQFNTHSPKTCWLLTQHYNTIYEYHMLAAMRAKNAMEQIKHFNIRRKDEIEFIKEYLKINNNNDRNHEIEDSNTLPARKEEAPCKRLKTEDNTEDMNEISSFQECLNYLQHSYNVTPVNHTIDINVHKHIPLLKVN